MGVLSPLSGGEGQNEYSGAKQVTRNFYLYAKIREHMMIRSTFLLSQVPVTISVLAFNSETKISSDSLCPTLPITIISLQFPSCFIWEDDSG